jgi:hypothetical protein
MNNASILSNEAFETGHPLGTGGGLITGNIHRAQLKLYGLEGSRDDKET